MRPPSLAVVRMRIAEAAQSESEITMAEVKLVNVKKIYLSASGEEKKSKKKKKGEEPAEEKRANLQITDGGVVAEQEFNLDNVIREFISSCWFGLSGGKVWPLRMVGS